MMKKATEKMKSYAATIANILDINKPTDNFESTRDFISENINSYKNKLKGELDKGICDIVAYNYQIIGFALDYQSLDFFKNLTKGIYIFWNNDLLLYIGKSFNLRSRIITSLRERNNALNPVTHVSYIELERDADVHILESILITYYKPIINSEFKCKDTSLYFKSPISIETLKKYKIIETEVNEDGRKKNVHKKNN